MATLKCLTCVPLTKRNMYTPSDTSADSTVSSSLFPVKTLPSNSTRTLTPRTSYMANNVDDDSIAVKTILTFFLKDNKFFL